MCALSEFSAQPCACCPRSSRNYPHVRKVPRGASSNASPPTPKSSPSWICCCLTPYLSKTMCRDPPVNQRHIPGTSPNVFHWSDVTLTHHVSGTPLCQRHHLWNITVWFVSRNIWDPRSHREAKTNVNASICACICSDLLFWRRTTPGQHPRRMRASTPSPTMRAEWEPQNPIGGG